MSRSAFNKIVTKLERLAEYVGYLRDIQRVNKKSFVSDYHFYGLAERYLQLAIESMLDIGKLIILSESLQRPENNQEIFDVLYGNKILSRSTIGVLGGIVGFRNILVHDYEKINRDIVYQQLKKNLSTFERFQKDIGKFLKKKK